MLQGRKEQIFFSIVESYIESGEPVGSKSLLSVLPGAVSSATIRNDMAYLTALGLIGQPHTSAGRIPTAVGIRYYLDNLMEKRSLGKEDKARIDSIFSSLSVNDERFLLKASDIFSDMLGLSVIGRTIKPEDKIDRLELLMPAPNTFVIVLLTKNKEVKSKIVSTPYPLSNEEISFFCENINRYLEGVPLRAVNISFIQSVAASFGLYGLSLSPLLSAISSLSLESEEDRFFIEGEANLLMGSAPDRQSLRAVKSLVGSGALSRIFPENEEGTKIVLGSEISGEGLTSLSIILTNFNMGDKKGSVGLIGPVRCDYPRIIPCLEYFADKLRESFTEGEK